MNDMDLGESSKKEQDLNLNSGSEEDMESESSEKETNASSTATPTRSLSQKVQFQPRSPSVAGKGGNKDISVIAHMASKPFCKHILFPIKKKINEDLSNDESDNNGHKDNKDKTTEEATVSRSLTSADSTHRPSKLLSQRAGSPQDEIRKIQQEKEWCKKIFEEYLAESNEQDVDLKEFTKGLQKLKVDLNEKQVEKLYDLLISQDDEENDGYLEVTHWMQFLTHKFEHPELQHFQSAILTK
ncbi:hypothetical protein RFI_17943, partial [Reticulomyxa filosa]